jgi:predicted ABC-type ATPase
MGGGSASGKSTVLTELQNAGDIPASGAVKIDADAFKLAIPEFHELRDRNDHRAGTFVHAESSLIASRTFEHAIAMRSDVIYDTTLSDYSKVVNLMNQARNGDYEIRIVGVTATPLTAISRMVERGKTTGRYVPIKALLTTHKNFARSFEKYVGLADAVELWKTDCADSKSAELIAVKQDDHLDILRPGDYAEFEKSRQLNENANTPDEI